MVDPDLDTYCDGAVIFGTLRWKWPWKSPFKGTLPSLPVEKKKEQEVADILRISQGMSFTDVSTSSSSQS